MHPSKRKKLQHAIQDLLNDPTFGDGKDGWYSETLADRMADAAIAVYDGQMEIQEHMRDHGVEP